MLISECVILVNNFYTSTIIDDRWSCHITSRSALQLLRAMRFRNVVQYLFCGCEWFFSQGEWGIFLRVTAQVVGNRQTRAVEDLLIVGFNSLRSMLLATVFGPLSDKSECV